MSEQHTLPLIAPRTPIAASADPWTSKASARELTKSGERDRQCREVYKAVCRWPGHTASELARLHGGLDRYQVGRRLSEISEAEAGQPERAVVLVVRGGKRRCKVTRRWAITWWPAARRDGDKPAKERA